MQVIAPSHKRTAQQVMEWLLTLRGVETATPIVLSIGKKLYPAVRYTQRRETPPNSPAWNRGEREYLLTAIYCVGDLPASYVRSTRIVYRFFDDSRDWFVMCYIREPMRAEYQSYHPHGANFCLSAWDHPDAIDKFDATPRKRMIISAH